MNERIKELILKAGFDHSQYTAEKLVHLVVKECAHLVDTLNEAYNAPSTAGKFIKEHFGVE